WRHPQPYELTGRRTHAVQNPGMSTLDCRLPLSTSADLFLFLADLLFGPLGRLARLPLGLLLATFGFGLAATGFCLNAGGLARGSLLSLWLSRGRCHLLCDRGRRRRKGLRLRRRGFVTGAGITSHATATLVAAARSPTATPAATSAVVRLVEHHASRSFS